MVKVLQKLAQSFICYNRGNLKKKNKSIYNIFRAKSTSFS